VKRSGIPRITPHDLRHSAASFAVSAGANVKAVQKMLGHASAAMTLDVYSDLFDGDLDSVSDALDHAVSLANVPSSLVWAKQKAPGSLIDTGNQGPFLLAVTVGFEPTLALTPNNISSVAPSAARTRHQPV
jgi:hypothetical protein